MLARTTVYTKNVSALCSAKLVTWTFLCAFTLGIYAPQNAAATIESFDNLGVEKLVPQQAPLPQLFRSIKGLALLSDSQQDICSNKTFSKSDLDNLILYNSCYLTVSEVELIPKGLYDFESRVPQWDQLKAYNNTLTASEFKNNLDSYINPDHSLAKYFDVHGNTLDIHELSQNLLRPQEEQLDSPLNNIWALLSQISFAANLPAKQAQTSEFFKSRQELTDLFKNYEQNLPLRNLRVAIDPGHIGGKWSEFEERHQKVGRDVIREGDLTFKTAITLKKFLEDQGAQVFMTRGHGEPGHPYELSSFYLGAISFIAAIKLQVPSMAQKLSEVSNNKTPTIGATRLYNRLLLFYAKRGFVSQTWQFRVEKLNQQKPDLIFFIHYNASSNDNFKGPQKLMSFVKGTVEKHRVLNPYFRFRALKDALRGDLFDAGVFAHTTMHTMSQAFKEPILDIGNWEDKTVMRAAVPSDIAQLTHKAQTLGVYAWNLGVMRYPDAPAALFEGTYMNHATEKFRLIRDYAKPLFDPSTRMTQYARALLNSIKIYVGQAYEGKRSWK